MMKQNWHDKGYEAYKSGQAKLLPYEKGAKYFNEGWDSAKEDESLSYLVAEHDNLVEELEGVKGRICHWGDELDLDALVDVLHGMGVRG